MSNSGPLRPGPQLPAAAPMRAGDRRIAYLLAEVDDARAVAAAGRCDPARALEVLEATLGQLVQQYRNLIDPRAVAAVQRVREAEVGS